MGYNKPITARIQHSTNKGMKVQEPLLDIGSAAKQVDTSADTNLISGAADLGASKQPVDVAKTLSEGMDKAKVPQKKEKEEEAPKGPAKQTASQTATFGPGGTDPNPKLYAGIVKEAKAAAKSLGPKGVGKNYKKGYYGK